MGASKRVAEMLVADAARRTGRPYVSVRFGNVLGSTGSVVPIFQEPAREGEPLTITHPEMTRYFMTIPEAGWLILDAAALGPSGDLFVLDMGEPVRIVDLARDLVRLAGRDPDSVPIRFIGLRPGEKLHEELFYETEQVEPTDVDKIFRVDGLAAPGGHRGARRSPAPACLRRSRRGATDGPVRGDPPADAATGRGGADADAGRCHPPADPAGVERGPYPAATST